MNIVDFKRAATAQVGARAFWTFGPKTTTLNGFKIITFDASQIVISWGDSTLPQTANSNEILEHTYSA
jgi:hypothetical protein